MDGQDESLRACGEQGVAFVPFVAIAGVPVAGRVRAAPTMTNYSPARARTRGDGRAGPAGVDAASRTPRTGHPGPR
jgi:hypothetical protein